MLAIDFSVTILPTDSAVENVLGAHGLDGAQNLGLLIMYGVRIKGDRRFHGGKREELEKMVGNHIPQGSGHIKVSAALFHSHSLGNGDLHVIHVAMVPYRLKDAVAKA